MTDQGNLPAAPHGDPDYEVIVIGAGVCGIYLAYRLKQMGARFTVLERAGDVGGTWHWNRYPGCRFDSESETYGYSFSKELLSEWSWTEKFAPRHETERYLHHVVDKFDLRENMQFNASVVSTRWDEGALCWHVGLADGRQITTRFLLTAIGLLSAPTPPRYAGVDSFKGQSFHTYNYPAEGVDYTGKRVAVIGTGATGVQLISAIADQVGTLTVFQRRPNWCAPLNNGPISSEDMADIKTRYDEIFARCHATPSGFLHDADPRKMFEVPAEEREAFWEDLYAGSGFGIWLGNFKDVLVDNEANVEFSKFVERKIRERVKDPAVADKLVPRDHGFGTRRVPMETRYYEVYNRDNVRLVDLSETPIESITPTGIRTSAEEIPFDIIIYATGFDAVTGAFERIDFAGVGGVTLKEKWREGPVAAFGLAVADFPNLLTVAGPLSGSVATNFPRGIEEAVDWCADFIAFLRERGIDRFEPHHQVEADWGEHVQQMAKKILFAQQQSWFTGYNSNIDRDYEPKAIVYAGGAQRYRRAIGEQTEQGYPGFKLKQA
ncbi:NAD(P)/FAD-dependent oxidoreductase [Sphingobium phenoxybenzoativorans]|uniref:NAD(P)/FAD-dependent oxidoreductase n=1 Tax=Sphingobium phenoxybenzoativorans TaxID=1592790 RepID=A0A975Q1T5_9SPHN|nr:NAD(P)/FAD-dependent oxidoreductase [Sphingobium phenoxybenzoativorans]QUT05757.1 NAD(P)/FAD-dependent oxidoreductase [Sphingobium phenoxybenzoativorans]